MTLLSDLLATPEHPRLDAAHDAIGPDTIAKFLLTSGSTGNPKAVINTQRMICANQVMLRETLAFLKDEPPVIVDWLPWNHTFGGNHNIGLTLYNGGSMYLDEGKPMPGGIEETVRNLREISPTVYFNVPKGYELLLPYLRDDAALRAKFFGRLHAMFFSGAALSPFVWNSLDELAVQETGFRVPMLTGLGATETSPFFMSVRPDTSRSGHVGLPVLGNDAKLLPNNGKLEVRAKGPNVTPGYWRQPELTAKQPSTRKAFTNSAMRSSPPIPTISTPASISTAASPRISSSPAAPGSASVRCARASSRPARRWCATSSSPASTATNIGAGDARSRRLPPDQSDASARRSRGCGVRSADPRRLPRAVSKSAGERHGFVDPDHARGAARYAAVDRSRRSHRQGLDQPARGARASQRPDRRDLCTDAAGAGDHAVTEFEENFVRENAMQLKDQAAIVTGGASGLGAATARRLAAQGAKVAVCDLNAKLAETVAAEIGGVAVVCDVSDAASAEAAIAAAAKAHGPARVLVNCAGIGVAKRVIGKEGPMALADFDRVIKVNLIGSFNMLRLATAGMSKLEPLATGERGVVISTASVAAYDGQIGQSAYSASKGGIVAMTLPIARELAQFGIRVLTIAPGLFLTPLLANLPQEAQDLLAAAIPFPRRLGHADEFASLALHMIDNPYLNGEVVRLDAALRMAPR